MRTRNVKRFHGKVVCELKRGERWEVWETFSTRRIWDCVTANLKTSIMRRGENAAVLFGPGRKRKSLYKNGKKGRIEYSTKNSTLFKAGGEGFSK